MSPSPPRLTVGPAPHRRATTSLRRQHLLTIFALVPAVVAGAAGHAFGANAVSLEGATGPGGHIVRTLVVEMGLDSGVLWFFGILGTVVLAMGVGAFVEYACQVAMRQPYRATDGHGALVGLLLALMMPPTIPWWIVIVGVSVAIFGGKQLFGGLGGYPVHPAVVGWLILLLSWPNYLYPVGAASIAAPDELAVVLTLAGGLLLWWQGAIRPQIPLAFLASVVVFSLIFGERTGGVAEQITSGHVVLGAFFLATDPTCSPANRRAMWAFGFGAGFLVMLIRAYGVWADAVPFAILLIGLVHPLLDRLRPPVVTGGVAS